MSDHAQFLAAILEDPDDDAPRLVYADWLEDQGDPRAEFIRVQCTLARQWDRRLNRSKSAAARRERARGPKEVDVKVLDRERELADEFRATWLAPLADVDGHPVPDGTIGATGFVRGVVGTWAMKAGAFLKQSNQQPLFEFASSFGIDSLLVQETTKRMAAFAESPVLEWVRELNWTDWELDDAGFAALVESPRLHRLASLRLSRRRLPDKGLQVLAKGNALPQLRNLSLEAGPRNSFTAAGVLAVLENEERPRLAALHVDAVGFRCDKFAAGSAQALSRLRCLQIFGGRNAGPIAACKHLTNLEELGLHGTNLRARVLRTLLDNGRLERLRRLTCRVADDVEDELIHELYERFGCVQIVNRLDD